MKTRLLPACLLAATLAACATGTPGPTAPSIDLDAPTYERDVRVAATTASAPRSEDGLLPELDGERDVLAAAQAEYVAGRILVKATSASAAAGAAKRAGGKVGKSIARLGVTIIDLPAKANVPAAVAKAAGAGIGYAEPDYIASAHFLPDDPAAQDQNFSTNPLGKGWHLGKIQAPQAWDGSKGEVVGSTEECTTDASGSVICETVPTYTPIKIAICDTGIDLDHPDLSTKIVYNADFTGSGTADDGYGHGSHVAGLAGGATHNTLGIAGVGFNATLLNIRVLDSSGNGAYSWIAAGIAAAADNGAQIINLSLGGKNGSTTLKDAVDYATGKGALVVASAGNSNSTKASYPAYYANAFAVAATTAKDDRAYYSNHGSWVDIAAPGGGDKKMAFTSSDEQIWSTIPSSYGYKMGTSMAAPVVSGAAALVLAKYPTLTVAQLRSRLQTKGDTLSWASYMKRLNANRAVNEP